MKAPDQPAKPGAWAAIPEGPRDAARQVTTAGHEALFAEPALRCDGCDGALPTGPSADADEDDAAVQGALLWARGEVIRFEPRPLCPACAAAIGLTALRQWEIEEEEG